MICLERLNYISVLTRKVNVMSQQEEYMQRILKVLIYIEEHLDDEITLEQLAKIAHYSPFHFHRLFQAIVGESVGQYVKRLRLEKAAAQLRQGEKSITEIALDSHYDTPSAFNKAFKQSMGESPSRYRAVLNLLHHKLKELAMITPSKIEKIPDLDVLFVRRVGSYSQAPWGAWDAMDRFIESEGLDKSKVRCFGIPHDDPQITAEDKLRYDACILSPGAKAKGEIGREVIKGGKYAIFIHHGPYINLSETFNKIFLKWLPANKEQYDDSRSSFTEYLKTEFVKTDPSKLETMVFVPLV